mgnify:CR=1 FL=1
MAKKTIKLAGITSGDAIEVDSKPVYKLTDDDVSAKKATAAGYGTFAWIAADASDTKFVADAALAGEISLAIGSGTIVSADFSKASAGIKFTGDASVTVFTGGAGNDTLIGDDATTSINAGAGNDLVSLAASATQTTVTLGAGADTLDISAVTATGNNKVFDYNYFEGDVIKVANGDSVTLNADGAATVGSATAASKVAADKVAIQDNWYGVKTNNGTADVDYFTAVNNNNLTVSKDLSNSVIANVVDASGAKNASITLGHKDDTVTLSTVSGVDTIKVGKSAGSNTLTNFNATEDIIAIDGVKMSDIKFDTTGANASIVYAASTLEAGISKNGKGSLNFNDGSKNHKMVYDLTGGTSTISYATASDADWAYSSDTTGKTVLEVGATTHLHETDKYVNITNISVSGSAKLDAPISLTGATGKANKIDATQAKVGTAVWGFSNGADSITLGSGQDTVWFGANDGKDTVTKFTYGTASDSDVLYLKDTKSLKDINVSVDGAGTNALFTVSKNDVLTMNTVVAGANNVAQIKLADEKIYKVAGNVEKADTVTVDTDNTDGLDFYAFDKTKAQTVVLKGGKDWVVNSLYTDFYTTGATIGAIDASAATGNVTLAAAADIKGGTGTNNIWTYQANTSATVTAGTGTDIIWFAENADQAVSVKDFTAGTDVVKFATAQSLKEIADNYGFATVAGGPDAKITGVNNTDSNMTITKAAGTTFGAFTITDANDKAYKALVSNGNAGTATFSADVNIYAGMATLEASKDFEGTVSVRVGKESRGLSSDTYFIDDKVTTFDASKSTATFWVAGNANAATTIKGGQNENYLYGGGAASDVLIGSIVAKDTFYFGTGDGTDTISGGVDKEDTIALWNIADADIANVKVTVDDKAGTATISLSDTSTLTISDKNAAAAIGDGLTFTSASQTAYTYDSESKTLVKKA